MTSRCMRGFTVNQIFFGRFLFLILLKHEFSKNFKLSFSLSLFYLFIFNIITKNEACLCFSDSTQFTVIKLSIFSLFLFWKNLLLFKSVFHPCIKNFFFHFFFHDFHIFSFRRGKYYPLRKIFEKEKVRGLIKKCFSCICKHTHFLLISRNERGETIA